MRARLAAVMVVGLVAAPRAGLALEGFVGTRPLSMGSSGRAFAFGDAGPILNPSGMTLMKTYTVEGAYAYANAPGGANFFHASVVDATPDINIAGGLSYTYLTTSPAAGTGTAHEVIAALALPFTELVSLGTSLKYVYATGVERKLSRSGGFTFDLGATVRPIADLSLAVVGADLTDVVQEGGRAIGYAGAYIPAADVLLTLDGLSVIGSDFTGHARTSVLAGGEVTFARRVVFRAGAGYSGPAGAWRGSLGIAALSQTAALDVALQQDLSLPDVGSGRVFVLGVSLRLFVPAPSAAPQ
jgi:hypothetical protein